MKRLGYRLLRLWVRIGLHLYFGKINVSGLENVPSSAPVLFLPNHQNSLLDVLLIGIDCKRSPWFLTRSDVFKNKTLAAFFEFLKMIPVYRIRDGRESLQNNKALFERCSDLLCEGEAVLMFPEANHNLKRRVRSLSKGFTRILFNTLQNTSDIDVQIVPVGLNYREALDFPDRVTVCFGEPISARTLYNAEDERGSIEKMKKVVSDRMKLLTTHIADEPTYDLTIDTLKEAGVDFLNPSAVNTKLKRLKNLNGTATIKTASVFSKISRGLFTLLNFPVVFIWSKVVKPEVPEPEFTGTFRYAFSMLVYPMYYLILFVVISLIFNSIIGIGVVTGLFFYNWGYVKMH